MFIICYFLFLFFLFFFFFSLFLSCISTVVLLTNVEIWLFLRFSVRESCVEWFLVVRLGSVRYRQVMVSDDQGRSRVAIKTWFQVFRLIESFSIVFFCSFFLFFFSRSTFVFLFLVCFCFCFIFCLFIFWVFSHPHSDFAV